MSQGNLAVALKIQADVGDAVRKIKEVDQGLGSLATTGREIGGVAGSSRELSQATAAAAAAGTRYATAASNIATQSHNAATQVANLTQSAVQNNTVLSTMIQQIGAMAGAYLGFQGIMRGIDMADSYGQMADRIRMATASTAEYEMVQARLLETASNTYRPLAEAQELYIRTGDAIRALGYTTTGALDITDSFSYLLVTNAASADRAANAINAFSKSIQTGKIDSESWQSILAAMPTLVNAIAKATGKSAEEIRKLGVEGKLSLKNMVEGFRLSLDENKAAADGMATTVRDAWQRVMTSMSAYLGKANETRGVTANIAATLRDLAEHFDTVANVVGVVAVAAVTRYAVSLTMATGATLKQTAAQIHSIVTEVQMARAQVATTASTLALARAQAGLTVSHTQLAAAETAHVAATTRLAAARKAAFSLLGGPAGLATAAALAAASFFLFRDAADSIPSSLANLEEPIEKIIARFLAMTEAARSLQLQRLNDEIQGLKSTYQETAQEINRTVRKELFNVFSPPSDETRAALEIIRETSRQAAQGIKVDWSAAARALDGTSGISDDLKRKLREMIVQAEDTSIKATGLRGVFNELTKSIQGTTDAIDANNKAMGAGSKAAKDYIERMSRRLEDAKDPTEKGKALRDLRDIAKAKPDEQVSPEDYAAAEKLGAALDQEARLRNSMRSGESEAKRRANEVKKYVEQLERQAAIVGLNAAQVREYELKEKKLTGTLHERAAAALGVVAAQEKKKEAEGWDKENKKDNAGLEADMLRASGREMDAALHEIDTRFAEMKTEFQKRGNEAGLALIEKLIPVEKAKTQIDEIQRQIDKINVAQGREEQSIDAEKSAGLITELEARERLLEVHKRTYDQLQQLRPVLADLARQPGIVGEQATIALQALDLQATKLQATTTLLSATLKDGVATGLREALVGLAEGTMELNEAINALGNSVGEAMIKMAADDLAKTLSSRMAGLLGGGAAQGAELATGAAAVTSSAGALAAAGNSLIVGASAINASAAALASATGAASASSAAAGAASNSGSLIASIGKLFGYASGGWTGAGGKYQPAGIVHADEFVTRQEVVRQPGALEFLTAFNRTGMAALTGLRGYAAGGLVSGVSAPALPHYTPTQGPAINNSTSLTNNQNFVLVDDPDRIVDAAFNTKAGVESLVVTLSRNPAKFRKVLGL